MGVTKDDENKKPAIYKFYDYTKVEIDIVNQRMGFYTCKTKSRRWTSTALAYVLDSCRVNAATGFALNHKEDFKKLIAYNFIKMVVKLLIRPNIARRPLTGLTMTLRNDIKAAVQWIDAEEIAGPQVTETSQPSTSRSLYSPKSETRKRRYVCMSNAYGFGYKKSKANLPSFQQFTPKIRKAVCCNHI